VLTIRAMSDGKGYSSRHLEHSDYYAEGERVKGRWYGRGAELAGVSGEVHAQEFDTLRQGLDPTTGGFLRQRRSADRIGADGERVGQGRSLYDFTISAPKSISVMALLGGDARLVHAHETAVADTLRELESLAATRVRQSGANADRVTGNLALAVYHHDTSRELDPQLHTHAVAANITWDGTEGRWKALQASGIYERRAYLTEVYRNALAREVRKLGYEIESQRDAKGRDCGLEIAGVSNELLTKFSQRSRQRDAAIRAFVEKNGRQPSGNEVAVLVRESRADKLIEISTAELRSHQRQRLTPEENRQLAMLRMRRRGSGVPLDSPELSLRYAEEHVFERVSVAKDHEILTEALRHGRGRISTAELKGALALQEGRGEVVRDGGEIATADSLQRERGMIDSVNRGIGAFEPLGANAPFTPSERLGPEQKRVVAFVLASRDRAVNICGAAGTGKTATLRELRRGLVEAGRNVVAIAPTMSAVEELQKVGFQSAVTVERLLKDQRMQALVSGRVLIVDEAGMVSARQMSELVRLAEQHSARIVFSGDTKQIQSVEAGDALRVLEKESRLKSATLTQVRRQTLADYRKAMEELRRDPERGFARLEGIGAVREVAWSDRAEAVARAYANAGTQNALVVCATHEEIDRVTEAIRADRKRCGALGEPVQLTRAVSLNWTTAQKQELNNYRPGMLLGFHREVKGIAKNETVEVVRVDAHALVVRNERGQQRSITGKQARSFDMLERQGIEVAVGDRLLLTANHRDEPFRATNGEIATVRSVDERGRIGLEDGRVLPADFRHFTHGYAVTAHRSQGKSVDSVIISADGMQKELFYVAASRGRRSVVVITSDRDGLRESVARSAARKSASELARGAQACRHRGDRRGLAAARDLARRVARALVELPGKVLQRARRERSHERGLGR
jgi:conjugative relaxase-like TrwC/TraI family protein